MSCQAVRQHEGASLHLRRGLLREGTQCESCTLWNSNSKALWKIQNHGDSDKISGFQELAGREDGEAQRTSRAVTHWHDARVVTVTPVIIHLSRPIACTRPRVNADRNYG